MTYTVNSAFAWTPPAAGQELTITWSFADLDSVDKILIGGQSESYVSPSGARWAFGGYPDFSATVSDAAGRETIRQAFFEWDVHSGINFVEVADSKNADIRVGVYGTGNGLVNAGESSYGHIDIWKGNDFHKVALELNPNALASQDRLLNTTLHQIGHALGLDDTAGLFVSSSPDVMNPSLMPLQLSADDIRGIQSLYGAQPAAPAYIAQVARLYEAGLDRKFDAAGLNYWIDQREAGMSLTAIAAQYLDSPEFTQRFGDDDAMSNNAFTTRMYLNVLDRAPDAGGLAYWSNLMSSGMSREQVLINFADSAENLAHSGYLSSLVQTRPGWWDTA